MSVEWTGVPGSARPPRRTRRGSVYLMVLAVSLMVAVIGLAGVAAGRIELRRAGEEPDSAEAGWLAFSAVEHALSVLEANAAWRSSYLNGKYTTPVPLGSGAFQWKLVDEDGNLNDDPADRVRIHGRGTVGESVQMLSIDYDPISGPLDVLRTAIHTSGVFTVSLATLNVPGGPASTNSILQRNATINGDAEVVASLGTGTVTGTLTEPAELKPMPPASVFEQYAATATELPNSFGELAAPLLSATVNPWGASNPDGVYKVTVPGGSSPFKIRVDRILGTLLVVVEPTAKVKLQDPMLLEPYRADYPALIIRCQNSDVELQVPPGTISESSVGANLNPAGSPYQGESDSALDDVYPSVIRGLVHIIGPVDSVVISNGVNVEGTVIVDGPATVSGATISHDPALLSKPPPGYRQDRPGPDPTSWRREIDP